MAPEPRAASLCYWSSNRGASHVSRRHYRRPHWRLVQVNGRGSSRKSREAKRCIRLREVMNFTGHGSSTAFAQHLDVSPQRWEQRRRGILLGLELGLLLVPKCPGVTLDWLYLCKVEGVKLRMARALGALEGYPTGRLRRAEV